ncbi:MAG: LysR substrate-binding domain-containing protein [Sphingobacterium sp.]
MYDFRLKVFYIVAKRLSFTKAAEELYISQPAISKHIREIEGHYHLKLFDRNGNRIKLTTAGTTLLNRVERLWEIYDDIDRDLAVFSGQTTGCLRVGASTTVAQYFIPAFIASFRKLFPDVSVRLTTHNTEGIENMLNANRLDIGIVEGDTKLAHFKYDCVSKDEIVLCTRSANPHFRKTFIQPHELKALPLILREPGSGSRDVLSKALKNAGISLSQLQVEMELENTESIKSYLMNSDSLAFLSIHSIYKELKENELRVVELDGIDITRCFYFVTPHGEIGHLSNLFFKHLQKTTGASLNNLLTT